MNSGPGVCWPPFRAGRMPVEVSERESELKSTINEKLATLLPEQGFAQVACYFRGDLCSLNSTCVDYSPMAIFPQKVGTIPNSNID